jgi:hypothetical protein
MEDSNFLLFLLYPGQCLVTKKILNFLDTTFGERGHFYFFYAKKSKKFDQKVEKKIFFPKNK